METIYLDNNATSALDPEALEAMRPFWLNPGNAESRHSSGRAARRAWDESRETVARILNADPTEVVFTSGGTEANNLALFGLAGLRREPGHLVMSPIEHPAVAVPIVYLMSQGFAIDRPEVRTDGLVDPELMAATFRSDTRLATLMLAHNEIGAIEPVARLASLAADAGIPVHTDAVQAVGRIPVDFHGLGVATLAASAHKFHGPIGAGLLLVRKGIRLAPHLLGGGQQQGRRAGTPAVALAVGLAKALERWHVEAETRTARWLGLRDRLEAGLIAGLGHGAVVRNGPADGRSRLPQTLNVGFPGLDGDALLMQLDLAGIAASIGAACASGTMQPSSSFVAMRIPADRLRSSVRFSLGATTTEAEIDEAVRRIVELVKRVPRSARIPEVPSVASS
jgi:cysteine desulfurase